MLVVVVDSTRSSTAPTVRSRTGVPTPHTARRAGVLLLPLLLIFSAACAAGPSDRPAVAYLDSEQQVAPSPPEPKPAPVPPLEQPGRENLTWQDCTGQTREELGAPAPPPDLLFSCSRLLTTLDSPESPSRGIARTSLLSVGSGDIPLVVLNDAGGEPGTTYAARLATRLPPEVLNTFRLIGMDRRGTGKSEPADCIPQAQREAIVGFDPLASDLPTLQPLIGSIRDSSQECLLTLDDRLQAYDTWRAAGDLEELRIELGVPKLHAIGRGEASRLLTTFSERFPTSVGRMVLDGAPDPMLDIRGQLEARARSAEETFDVFAAACDDGKPCPLGPEPRRNVRELVERVRTEPLTGAGSTVSAGKVVRGILQGLQDRESWPELADALAAADRGDGTPIAALAAPLFTGSATTPARLDGDLITSCNDTTIRVPPQRGADIATEWTREFELFGGVLAQRLVRCSLWPVPQDRLPTPNVAGLPPIPVVSTTHDPLTPAKSSEHMAQQLPSGVLINWQGAGHGAIGKSDCATDAVSRYLVDGVVPADDLACPA
ncbi:alpha/beta hydrolase [Parasphingorhabdus pacifica]